MRDRPLGNDVALTPAERQQLVDPFAPSRAGMHWHERDQRVKSLDFGAMVRIAQEHRWLIAGGVVLGIVLDVILTLMTKPQYRANVTLEVMRSRTRSS